MPASTILQPSCSKPNSTPDERAQLRKHQLEKRYCAPLEPERVIQDDNGWFPQIRLHYYLTLGYEYLPKRDREKAEAIASEDGKIFAPDLNRSQLSNQIAALKVLGIDRLLEKSRLISNADKDLIALAELVQQNIWATKAVLNISIRDDDTPIQIVCKLIAKLGLKLECVRRTGSRGERTRIYRITPPEDDRFAIFAKWAEREACIKYSSVSTSGNKDPIASSPDTNLIPPMTQVGALVVWAARPGRWLVERVEGAIAYLRRPGGGLTFEALLADCNEVGCTA
ncbi:MAG: hypothetical protein AAFY15_13125 [Cyanobacteria bacterium J06648_11]